MKYLHTMVRVSDLEKSLGFYTEVLNLKVSRTMELEGEATLYFLTDGKSCSEIELTYNHNLPDGGYTHGTYFGHFAFETDNMDKFSEKLKNLGFEYSIEPFLITETGPKIAFLKDPDGYQIEIIEKRNKEYY